MKAAAEILELLSGHWRIDRKIIGEGATLSGDADFAKAADGALAYSEKGVLVLANGQELQAFRKYTYRADSAGLIVEFADGPDKGKTFVELSFVATTGNALEARDVHQCGADTYTAHYILDLPDRFQTDIVVSGPRKDYRTISTYSRR